MSVTFRQTRGILNQIYEEILHIRSVIYGKKESEHYWKAAEWWMNGTEWSLKCTCHSVDWMVTDRWLNGAFQFSRNGGVWSCEDFRLKITLSVENLAYVSHLSRSLQKNKHVRQPVRQQCKIMKREYPQHRQVAFLSNHFICISALFFVKNDFEYIARCQSKLKTSIV